MQYLQLEPLHRPAPLQVHRQQENGYNVTAFKDRVTGKTEHKLKIFSTDMRWKLPSFKNYLYLAPQYFCVPLKEKRHPEEVIFFFSFYIAILRF